MKRLLLCAAILLQSVAARTQSGLGTIPPVHATTLTGVTVDLPQGLHGKVGILVIGFSQESRDQVAAWGHRLTQEYDSSPDVATYQLAQLQSVPRLLRGMVTRKVAAGVSERGRPHFLVIADREPEWKQATAFSSPADAYILLVDSSGAIRARTHGPLTDRAWDELKRQTQAALPGHH